MELQKLQRVSENKAILQSFTKSNVTKRDSSKMPAALGRSADRSSKGTDGREPKRDA